MKYNQEIHHRQSIRLKGHDYSSPGSYFVTICTHNRGCILGKINNGEMSLNQYGGIVRNEWLRSKDIRSEIVLGEFIIMPNHIHGIVIIVGNYNDVGANGRSPLRMKSKTISAFVAGYKSVVTKQINQIRQTPKQPIWQRNYHDRIIRDERELSRIQEYIINNPLKWQEDNNNPANFSVDGNGPVNKITDEGWNL